MIRQQHRLLTVFFLVLSLLSAQWVLGNHVHDQDPLHQHASNCTLYQFHSGDHVLPANGELPLAQSGRTVQYAIVRHLYSESSFIHFLSRAPPFFSL